MLATESDRERSGIEPRTFALLSDCKIGCLARPAALKEARWRRQSLATCQGSSRQRALETTTPVPHDRGRAVRLRDAALAVWQYFKRLFSTKLPNPSSSGGRSGSHHRAPTIEGSIVPTELRLDVRRPSPTGTAIGQDRCPTTF